MPISYLDKDGLEYFWSKLKIYIDQHSGSGGSSVTKIVGGSITPLIMQTGENGVVASDIIVAASGVTIQGAALVKFGSVIQLDINFTLDSDLSVPASGNIADVVVGTIVEAFRPVKACAWTTYGNDAGFASGYIESIEAANNSGVMKICACDGTGAARTIASGSSFRARTTYIISEEYVFQPGSIASTWVGDGIPVGTIMDFAGPVAPAGYLTCDGSAVSRSTYASLFAVIGTTWGSGDGSTTFNIPDFRGRTSIGSGTGTAPDATAHALGSGGGMETVTLTTSQIPAHSHDAHSNSTYKFYVGQADAYFQSDKRVATASSSGSYYFATQDTTRGFTEKGATENAGGGGSHSNMTPYRTVNKIIKAIPDTPASGGIDLSTTTASLGTTGWSNNSKTVNVTGVTASNTVIISPAPASIDDWESAGIACTAQGSGTLTFSCDTVPSSSITVNILILEEDAA